MKFGADKSLLSRYEKLIVRLYFRTERKQNIELNLMPDGGVNRTQTISSNEWVTVEFTMSEVLGELGWSVNNEINYTNLFWFTNAGGNTVSALYVAGMQLQ